MSNNAYKNKYKKNRNLLNCNNNNNKVRICMTINMCIK